MADMKRALTRKLGPLPAWAWAIVAFVAVYWYRNRTGGGTGVLSTGATNQPGPITSDLNPQPQTTLQPGEAVYDPNTGALVTSPFGPPTDQTANPTNSDIADAINGLTGALISGQGQAVNLPGGTGTASTATRATQPKLRGKGAVRAPFGHNKPTAPKGYRAIGLGKGFWEFLPTSSAKRKAKAKTKPGTAKPKQKTDKTGKTKRSAPAKHSTPTRQRSSGGASVSPNASRSRAVTAAASQVITRARPTNPVTKTATTQRPAATHPAPRPAPRPTPHPAAPKPAPKKAVRKRGK